VLLEISTVVEATLTSVKTILTSLGLVLTEAKGYWDVSGCVGICRIMVTDIKMVLTSVRMMMICVGTVLIRNNCTGCSNESKYFSKGVNTGYARRGHSDPGATFHIVSKEGISRGRSPAQDIT
jgi:hypothetical protein